MATSLSAPAELAPIDGIERRVSRAPAIYVDYEAAVAEMEARAAAIRDGSAAELAWFLEHPPLITAGTSAPPEELLEATRFPVHRSGRGGRHTYHGPGQRIGYLLLDLAKRGPDIRCYVASLERWLIASLAHFDVVARTAPGRIGIWVDGPQGREAKIGAIGVRVRRWVTMHGFSINLAPDLGHFGAIVPCGISEFPVTSLAALGKEISMEELDQALWSEFPTFLQSLTACAPERFQGG